MHHQMTSSKSRQTGKAGRPRLRSLQAAARQVIAWYRRWLQWRARKKAAEDLRYMPDYILKDLGISRSQIDAVTGNIRDR